MKNFSDIKTLLIECKEGKGKTVLHFAAARGDIDIFDYLLSEGADLNALDDEKNTPFFIAIQHEKIKLIKHLIERLKVDPKAKRNNDVSCIHLASMQGNQKLVDYLLG